MLIDLMAEQLRIPAFSEQEFEKLKVQLQGAVRQQQQDTDFRAGDAFSRAIYPVGHPNRQPTAEQMLADMGKTTIAEVRQFHEKYYGPTGMRLVIVGDVDPVAAQAEVRKAFSGWTGGSLPPAATSADAAAEARTETVFMADKTSVSVVLGQATRLRFSDPDSLALRLGTRIFGSGFAGRLMANVRDKEGLTYGIGAFLSGDSFTDGDWRIRAAFARHCSTRGWPRHDGSSTPGTPKASQTQSWRAPGASLPAPTRWASPRVPAWPGRSWRC